MLREPEQGIVHRERFPAEPASVTRARRLVRRAATDAEVSDEVRDAAELLVSELVTNAVVHAGTPIEVQVSADRESALLVETSDGSSRAPTRAHFAETAGTGRGLRLLEEMADDWGWRPRPGGKTVWFRVGAEGRRTGRRAETVDTGIDRAAGRPLEVVLLNFPVVLHAAWQEDARALLREYLLVQVEEDAAEQVLRHAECSDAADLLDRCVPAPESAGSGAAGSAPEVFCPRVSVQVPAGAVAHFATLQETLERATALSDTDALLTPTTEPAERAFRSWVCRQVAAQARGEPPTPWAAP